MGEILKTGRNPFFYVCLRARTVLWMFLIGAQLSFGQSAPFQSSNLPIFIINTQGNTIVDEPKILADLEIIYNGPGKRNSLTDSSRYFRGSIGVEYRGSTSQTLSPKKPLGFETRKEDGESNLNVSLLGMPEENDWILLAPYSDKSLMRDVLIHHVARQITPYSSRTAFCELVTNGQYMGVYALMEKIKRDKNRVNIRDLEPKDVSGDKLTGGYILKIDKTTGSNPVGGFDSKFRSGNGNNSQSTFYQYEHPEVDVLTDEQKSYIRNLVHAFEASFLQPDYTDPVNGYRKWVDEESMIRFMILNELANNVDGYRLSTFLYKDADNRNKKIHFGPIWDFNLGFGNANYCEGGSSEVLAFEFNNRCPADAWQVPFYWHYLTQDSLYNTNLYKRWSEWRKTILSEQNLMAAIDSMAALLEEAQVRNFQRWNILSQHVWPNAYVGGSYSNEIQYLKNWLSKRLVYLDGVFKQATLPKYYPERYFEPVVFPNPALQGQEVTFKYYIHDYDQIRIEVHDILGRRMFHIEDGSHYSGTNQVKSTSLRLPSGIYVYNIYIEGQKKAFQTGKLLIR
ncbi:MAG TPA: CotH kinase family protein [Saprospiraceae bacterium]|nr:CotH kinase family protein [Saprospiraceae bacterium]